MARLILHVDLNSFFASVEQQLNPQLRGLPIGIIKEKGRSCVIACSNEAKIFGVKTGMSLQEIRLVCPQLILVPARFAEYGRMTRIFINLCSRFSDEMEIFSLDEVFLDITHTAAWFGGPLILAKKLQLEVQKKMGEWIGCSIGIAENKLLAKMASGVAPKRGILIITEANKQALLNRVPFTEVCGIGWHLTKRLNALGINSLPQILTFPEDQLKLCFGPYWSDRLKQMARGKDDSLLVTVFPQPKSVSRTFTLFQDTRELQLIKATLRNLVEEACAKLRRLGLAGRQFGVAVRGQRHTRADFVTRKACTDCGSRVFSELYTIYNHWHWPYSVRFLVVWVGLLTRKDCLPEPLFSADKKQEKLWQTVDLINQTHGSYMIYPGTLINQSISRPEINGFTKLTIGS